MNHFGIPYQGEATHCFMMRKVMQVVDLVDATKFLHSVSMGLAILCDHNCNYTNWVMKALT